MQECKQEIKVWATTRCTGCSSTLSAAKRKQGGMRKPRRRGRLLRSEVVAFTLDRQNPIYSGRVESDLSAMTGSVRNMWPPSSSIESDYVILGGGSDLREVGELRGQVSGKSLY